MPSSQHRHYYQVDSTIAAEESQALLTFSQQQFSRGGEHENQPPSAWGIALDKKPPFSITKGLLLHAHCGGNGTFGSDKFEIELGGTLHT